MTTRPCAGGHTLHFNEAGTITGISDSLWPIISVGDTIMSVGRLRFHPPLGTRGVIVEIKEPFVNGRSTDIFKVKFPEIQHAISMKHKEFWTQVTIGETIVGPLAQNFSLAKEITEDEAWNTVLTICPDANVAGQRGVGAAKARKDYHWQNAFGVIVEVSDTAEVAIMFDGAKYLRVERPLK